MEARYTVDSLIGVSPALSALKEQVRLAARGTGTVLVLGETGTGKELVAHALHAASPRAAGPLARVNCAAVPAELMEAEFFGYAAGAFTGAQRGGRPGQFHLAEGGTLLLDEVSELPLALQAKLLRALQEKEVHPVGGLRPRRLDVRIVAASNQDLQGLVAAGRFRPDLFWRLNVITLVVPPLRERPEDVLPLAHHFLRQVAAELGVDPPAIAPAALAALLEYGWPGNVRELENALTRALYLGCGPWLELAHLPAAVQSAGSQAAAGPIGRRNSRAAGPPGPGGDRPGHGRTGLQLRDTVRAAEHEAIRRALARTGGNKSQAARLLGLSRSRLYEKLAEVDQ